MGLINYIYSFPSEVIDDNFIVNMDTGIDLYCPNCKKFSRSCSWDKQVVVADTDSEWWSLPVKCSLCNSCTIEYFSFKYYLIHDYTLLKEAEKNEFN